MRRKRSYTLTACFSFLFLIHNSGLIAQSDSIRYDESGELFYDKTAISLHLGLNHGFEVLDTKNANTSTAIPIGLDIKRYGSSSGLFNRNPYIFLQYSVSWVPMLVVDNFTSYLRLIGKYGFISKKSLVIFSIGPSYSFNLYGAFGNMYGGEFTIHQNNIPITVMFTRNFKMDINYYMIGVDINLANFRLAKGDRFEY